MPDIGRIIEDARKKIKAAEAEIQGAVIEGTSGGGMVKVRCRGSGDVIGVEIAPDLVDPNAIAPLEDLLLAAFNDMRTKHQAAMMGTLEKLGGVEFPFAMPSDDPS